VGRAPPQGRMTQIAAYARLVRLPNVFTALSDVSIGLIVTSASLAAYEPWLLLLASASLYSAGMAWNDFFDRQIDRLERPERPIPSGQISPGAARAIAVTFSGIGIASAAAASLGSTGVPLVMALALLGLIVTYDGLLKATPLGPAAMGGCRFLNVQLGFALAPSAMLPWGTRLLVAAIVGVYVVGVTVFARAEAAVSRRSRLAWGAALIVGAVAAVLTVPEVAAGEPWRGLPYFVAGVQLLLLARLHPALMDPGPAPVQRFVKTAILGIIALDAALAAALAGPAGLAILGWLIPAVLIGRRVYST